VASKKVRLNPAELIVGMRASYHHGVCGQVFTGNIIRIIHNDKRIPTHVFIGMCWIKADQLFQETTKPKKDGRNG